MKAFDYAIVGGGIVGLATALQLGRRFPGATVLVLEKEAAAARHQTGRNSGVIHSGIYYKPGSYKARFARAGAESMTRFCEQHDIPHDTCGKLIVATRAGELPGLDRLFERGRQNGVPVERIGPEQAREIEPHVRCVGALRVLSTGITSYRAVGEKYLELIHATGGVVEYDCAVKRIRRDGPEQVLATTRGDYRARFVINCAGLHSDRVARAAGAEPGAQIVPFRGEYYELKPGRRHLVKALIYPVPNPDFPFLGAHFTKMIDGSVHAGPNAVLAFAREGYRKTDLNVRDLAETLAFPGFWRLARKNLGEGLGEMHRSLSKAAFTRSLRQLVPAVTSDDLAPCAAGIRAQALTREGRLVDDFHFVASPGALHVCNAPSPAATASLEIGAEIVRRIPAVASLSTTEISQ